MGTFLPNYIHVGVKEPTRGVNQLVSLRGEAFEGGTFLYRRKDVFILLAAVGSASALALWELAVPKCTTGTRLQMQPVWVGSSLVDFNFPEMQGHGGILTGGEYGGIGAWKKEEVSVLPFLSTTAGTPLSFGEVLISFLHPFSEVSGAKECVHEFWEGENHPSPTHRYSP